MKKSTDEIVAVYTPDNEPYLGRESVYHFDQVILSCMEVAWRQGHEGDQPWTHLILWRKKGETKWKLEENSYERKATVKHQTMGKTYEYCVAASNKAGESR